MTGTLEIKRKTEFGEPYRFLESIKDTDRQDCIEWPYATLISGYGKLRHNKKEWRAHRLSLILSKGEPPTKKHAACHAPIICHNRKCVNPNHLRWATIRDNNADIKKDGSARGRNSKLTKDDVIAIRNDSRSARLIAADFGVAKSTIYGVKSRRKFAWVTE